MPYKWATDKVKLPREADRRVKLTEKDRDDIRRRYKAGEGIRAIARVYEDKCSRRTVQFVLFPEREALVHKQAKERAQHKKSYTQVRGEQWARIMREHRRYKQKILTT